jgi:hypothetical protein
MIARPSLTGSLAVTAVGASGGMAGTYWLCRRARLS